nr:serpin family protein [Propionibacterium sp.]
MNRRRLLALAAVAAGASLLPGCSVGPTPTTGTPPRADAVVPPPDAGSAPLPSPVAPFAGRLNPRLGEPAENLVWSPWSVAMVLAMIRAGAAGATASELSAVLGADADFDERLADGWRRMAHATGEPLHAGNAVWAQRGLPWKQPFLDRLAALAASLKDTDFAGGDPTKLAAEINAWVAGRTAGKITDLLSPSVLTPLTRMVLVNAVHFKAAWLSPLLPRPAGTFAAPAGAVRTPYLASGRALAGRRSGGWTSALLPCEHGQFGLAVALADDPDAAPADVPLPALTGIGSDGPRVLLTLPPWKDRFRAPLNDALAAAGMPSAFDEDRTDFSGMTDAQRLFLKLVVHEAVIEVDEKGIEAAAATAGVMDQVSAPVEPPIDLVLDRPFAYALVHLPTATPLFLGRVLDPAATP